MRIQVIDTSTTISVYIVLNNLMIASSECSFMNDTWFFNRLFVKENYRGNGYGSKVLDKMLEIVKNKNITLELMINPYGEMTYEQLETFYLRHGFEKHGICYYFNKKEIKKELQDLTEHIIHILKSNGFTIHRYDAYSTNSIYLKLDYGVCNSIRISDHSGKKYLKYRYNLIWDGLVYNTKDTYPRYYYNQYSINDMINKIILDRNQKVEKYGQVSYNKFMRDNNQQSANKKGFWAQAKLV